MKLDIREFYNALLVDSKTYYAWDMHFLAHIGRNLLNTSIYQSVQSFEQKL
jgi:hypothetical protein